MSLHISAPTRGRYIKPIPVTQAQADWIDDETGKPDILPPKTACQHPNHWQWGKGTRNGQKLNHPTQEMYYQHWHMTEKELEEAVAQYDMFSLEMKGRIICKDCADKETEQLKKIKLWQPTQRNTRYQAH